MGYLIWLLSISMVTVAAQKVQKTDGQRVELEELKFKISRLAPLEIKAATHQLTKKDQQALQKIILAAKLMDPIYDKQVWAGNIQLRKKIIDDKTELGIKRLKLFDQNRGPWSRMDSNKVFIESAPKEKPLGAGYYPEDMTKNEFEGWIKTLSPSVQSKATGFFSVIKRDGNRTLKLIPYSEEYGEFLKPAVELLNEAQELTENATLRKFLKLRAEAFLNDDYYASDVAWMDLDSPIELTIGPYETYEDELFGYKAAFEAFVTITDVNESQKLAKFSSYLQELENNLPLDDRFKNKKIAALAPIKVVDEVFAAGEARRGVTTAAFNLPNDEKVVKEKGSKRVMLKNIQQAKFDRVLTEISKKVLTRKNQTEVKFEPFFTHILMHELMHGIGPHNIIIGTRDSNVRMELKDHYSAVEEAKADITGLFALQYLIDKGVIDKKMENSMYLTFLASAFRSVRFGITEAHGRGVALQFNFLQDEGAIIEDRQGKFSIDVTKIKPAVKKLTRELLTLQAEGDYERARTLLGKYGIVRPAMQKALDSLKDVPVDIDPIFHTEEMGKI
ncbi:MAG: hypothetical protein EXR74_07450 [Bdellovibrionales bacterium]|nr:hypothetical protein [Bdellovibrionales bacterium]